MLIACDDLVAPLKLPFTDRVLGPVTSLLGHRHQPFGKGLLRPIRKKKSLVRCPRYGGAVRAVHALDCLGWAT